MKGKIALLMILTLLLGALVAATALIINRKRASSFIVGSFREG